MTEAAAAPAASPPAAPAPPAGAPAASPVAAPPPAPPIAWFPDADAEMVGHVQNKGWKTAADAAQAHRSLEKLMGADRAGRTVVVPAGEDPVEWNAFHERLGRPATPEGYGFKAPAGGDQAYVDTMAKALHDAGISATAAKKIVAANDAYVQAMLGQQDAATAAAAEAEEGILRKDWGNEYDARREIARRAAVKLGFDEKQIDDLQKTGSYSKTLKILAKMGDLMGEHGAEGLNAPGSFGMTPEGAAAQLKQLKADPEWAKLAMNPDSKQWAELTLLNKIITGS